MKLFFYSFLLILTCIAASGCEEATDADAAGQINAAGIPAGKWIMLSMTLNNVKTQAVAGNPITITFSGNRVHGSGACNSYDGTFTAEKSGEFQFNDVGWTEMACADPAVTKLDSDYSGVLSMVQSFSVNAKQLILSDGTAANQVVFVPFQPPAPLPLKGTTWNLETFEETTGKGDSAAVTATPVLKTNPISFRIKDGKASGSSGCNSYGADVEVGKGTLRVGQLESTLIGCPGEVQKQEQRFTSALRSVTRYEITGNRLRLSNAEGTLSLLFSAQP